MTIPGSTPTRAVRCARLLAPVFGLLLLAAGLFGVFVRHAPPTTWAVPVTAGHLVGDSFVHEVRRQPAEVRLEVGPRGEHPAPLRIVHRRHPDHAPLERVTVRTRVLAPAGVHRTATVAEIDAVAARIAAWEARWPRPPPFVRAVGARATPLQELESVLLEIVVVVWLAGLVATAPGWASRLCVRPAVLVAVLVFALLPAALVAVWDLGGVWHSNQHGQDRIADVEALTPPAVAALGLLHGHGYYTVFQALHALTGLGVLALAPWVTAAGLLAVFGWLRALWDDEIAALLGTAVLAMAPVLLRLAGTEDMYVPVLVWVPSALLFAELHLRTDEGRWLLLSLGAAFLAMQTRAELLLLVPAWIALRMLVGRPAWLRTAWRRPVVLLGLGVAAVAFVPRLLALVGTPPPPDLRRTFPTPLQDPRQLALAALAVAGLAIWPALRPRLLGWWRRPAARVGVLLAGGVALAGYLALLHARGGPTERAWQLHTAMDPAMTAPWVGLAVLLGVREAVRRTPDVAAWLLLAVAGGVFVYLPQYDSHSTYVRTSLATWPFLAALAGVGLAPLWRQGIAGRLLVVAALVGGIAWGRPWLVHRWPKQLQGDLVAAIPSLVPEDAVLVWLSEADVGEEARGFRVTRAHLDRWLPDHTVVGVDAWLRGEAPADRPAFFVRTADCHRLLFRRRGTVALAGHREVTWRYLDVPDITVEPRVAVDDLPEDWIDPRCARMLDGAEPVREIPLERRDVGSVYETLFGTPRLGLYRLR